MTACRACGGACGPWRTARGGEPADQARYTLLRCGECGTAMTVEPASAGAHSTGAYAARAPRLAGVVRALQRLVARDPLRLLSAAGVRPGDRVLDAGAGTGRLVTAMRDAGYEARGIDPSPRTDAAHVEREAIEEHEDAGLRAVVLWHVLEHLDDPTAALRRIAGWLAPGGTLVVGVPNVASLQAGIARGDWFHLDLPRHRTHFTPRGLEALLGEAGFRTEHVRHLVLEHNVHGMWFALLTRLGMTPGFPFHLLKRNVRPRARDLALLALAGPLLLPVAAVLELAAAVARRGGTIAVVARLSKRHRPA
jgi:SAM-dependent methyltransferase